MILITAGWGQICPDKSDMFWHISCYLAGAPVSQNTLSMPPPPDMTGPSQARPCSSFIIRLLSVFTRAQLFSGLGLGLSLLLAKFWYLESCRNYFPSWTGQIPLSPPLLIIEQYFVSGLISLAVLSVEINNKLKCGDGVQCELVQQCCKAVYYS